MKLLAPADEEEPRSLWFLKKRGGDGASSRHAADRMLDLTTTTTACLPHARDHQNSKEQQVHTTYCGVVVALVVLTGPPLWLRASGEGDSI